MRILGIASVPEGRTGGMQRVSAGLPRMVGDGLCFTDDDAEPLPDWLERLEHWYADPTVVGVGGRDLPVNQPQTIDERCRVVGRYGGRLVYDPRIRVRHYASPRPEWGRDDPI